MDVIISTISLDQENVEYIQVDPLLNDEDCIRVGEKLSKIKPRNQKKVNRFPPEMKNRSDIWKNQDNSGREPAGNQVRRNSGCDR